MLAETERKVEAAIAVDAVEKWRFAPGMKNGLQVNVRTQIPITFALSNSEDPVSPEQAQRELAKSWF